MSQRNKDLHRLRFVFRFETFRRLTQMDEAQAIAYVRSMSNTQLQSELYAISFLNKVHGGIDPVLNKTAELIRNEQAERALLKDDVKP